MRLTSCFAAVLAGGLLVSPLALAGPDAPATVQELVSAVERTYGGATSIRAEFVQVDRNKALGSEVRQRGRIALERPRKMRVEMGFPVTHTMVSDGSTMWAYSVKDKQVFETPELGGGGGMGVLLEDLSKLGELFEVSLLPVDPVKPSVSVRLIPRQQGAFKSLELTLSRQKYALEQLRLTDQLDNTTEMSFSMVTMNKDIPDTEFRFVAPPGVKVVKAGAN